MAAAVAESQNYGYAGFARAAGPRAFRYDGLGYGYGGRGLSAADGLGYGYGRFGLGAAPAAIAAVPAAAARPVGYAGVGFGAGLIEAGHVNPYDYAGEVYPAAEPYFHQEIPAEPYYHEEIPAEPYFHEEIPAEPYIHEEIPAEPYFHEEIPAEPYFHEEIPAEPYFHQEIPAEPYFHQEPVAAPVAIAAAPAIAAEPVGYGYGLGGFAAAPAVPAAPVGFRRGFGASPVFEAVQGHVAQAAYGPGYGRVAGIPEFSASRSPFGNLGPYGAPRRPW